MGTNTGFRLLTAFLQGPLIKDNFSYRREIDGLRAIAVLAVVVYHFDLFHISGGFIGVDIFFVISGFLISSIIMNQIEAGRFSITEFYVRRARRILPALSIVLLATTLAGWFLLLPMPFDQYGASMISVSLFSANIFFWRNLGYFGPTSEEIPLLHCWSLAVEEQFYFILPISLIIIFALFRKRSKGYKIALAAFIAFVWIVSLLMAEFLLLLNKQQAAFYLLPPRAWELLTGAIVALMPMSWIPKRLWHRELLAFLGLAGIILPCFALDSTTPFPGVSALFPCVGTAILIFVTANRSQSKTIVAKILTTRAFVSCGLISYSLYLWHWPIWVFLNYYKFDPLSPTGVGLVCVTTFLISWLSWRFIEQPFRHSSKTGHSIKTLAWAALSILLFCAFGGVLVLNRGLPIRFSSELNQALAVPNAWGDQTRYELELENIRNERAIPLVVSNEGTVLPNPDILLWGDSHAMAIIPAIEQLCNRNNLTAVAATHSSTAPVIGWEQQATPYGLGKDAQLFNELVLEFIRNRKVKNVVFAAFWEGYYSEDFAKALITTVEAVAAAGAKPWFFIQVPRHPFPIPKALARMTIWNESDVRYRSGDSFHPLYGARGDKNPYLDSLIQAGATIIDARDAFWEPSKEAYRIVLNGQALYHDTAHITRFAAETLVLPVMEDAMIGKLSKSAELPTGNPL